LYYNEGRSTESGDCVGYLLILLRTLIHSSGNVMRKNYVRGTAGLRSSTDVYMLVAHLFASVFLFLLAKGSVALDLSTFLFAVVYAAVCGASAFASTQAYKTVNFLYVSIFSGAGGLLVPFLFELLTGVRFSPGKLLSVFLRVAAILIPMLFQREKIKGIPLCFVLFFTSGLGTVVMRLFSASEVADNSSSMFFWTNVLILPVVLAQILRKYKLSDLKADMKKVKPRHYLYIMAPTAINNVASLLTVLILQMVSATISTVISSCFSVVLTAFLSAVLYKETLTTQARISMVLTILSAIAGVI